MLERCIVYQAPVDLCVGEEASLERFIVDQAAATRLELWTLLSDNLLTIPCGLFFSDVVPETMSPEGVAELERIRQEEKWVHGHFGSELLNPHLTNTAHPPPPLSAWCPFPRARTSLSVKRLWTVREDCWCGEFGRSWARDVTVRLCRANDRLCSNTQQCSLFERMPFANTNSHFLKFRGWFRCEDNCLSGSGDELLAPRVGESAPQHGNRPPPRGVSDRGE